MPWERKTDTCFVSDDKRGWKRERLFFQRAMVESRIQEHPADFRLRVVVVRSLGGGGRGGKFEIQSAPRKKKQVQQRLK